MSRDEDSVRFGGWGVGDSSDDVGDVLIDVGHAAEEVKMKAPARMLDPILDLDVWGRGFADALDGGCYVSGG